MGGGGGGGGGGGARRGGVGMSGGMGGGRGGGGGGGGGRFGAGMGMMRGGSGGGGGGGSGGAGMGVNDYQSQTGHSIHMRGLPFAANEQDVMEVCHGCLLSHLHSYFLLLCFRVAQNHHGDMNMLNRANCQSTAYPIMLGSHPV